MNRNAEVEQLWHAVQELTRHKVQVAFVDQGCSADEAARAAQQQGIELIVVKLEEAKKGFVLMPKRWVVKRSFAWSARLRCLS